MVTSIVETITPDIAKEYLKFNVANRPLNIAVVDYYAEQMRKGQWRLNGDAICFIEGGALGNGQHRLQAIIKANCPIDIVVTRGCDKDSFATYDSGRNRRVSDVFSINSIKNGHFVSSVAQKYLMMVRSGHALNAVNKCSAKNLIKSSKQDILDEYYTSPELYNESHRIADKCLRRAKLLNGVEVGALYVFLIKGKFHDKDVVERFLFEVFSLKSDMTEREYDLMSGRRVIRVLERLFNEED